MKWKMKLLVTFFQKKLSVSSNSQKTGFLVCLIKGEIRNLTAYGAFVELEEGIDGMIHVSDLSWTRKINHPSEVLKKGQELEAQVIDIDKTNQRISLGIKQLENDPWNEIDGRFKVGDLVKGQVAKIASFGAFVQLEDDIDGLVHISEIAAERIKTVTDVLNEGDAVVVVGRSAGWPGVGHGVLEDVEFAGDGDIDELVSRAHVAEPIR